MKGRKCDFVAFVSKSILEVLIELRTLYNYYMMTFFVFVFAGGGVTNEIKITLSQEYLRYLELLDSGIGSRLRLHAHVTLVAGTRVSILYQAFSGV